MKMGRIWSIFAFGVRYNQIYRRNVAFYRCHFLEKSHAHFKVVHFDVHQASVSEMASRFGMASMTKTLLT